MKQTSQPMQQQQQPSYRKKDVMYSNHSSMAMPAHAQDDACARQHLPEAGSGVHHGPKIDVVLLLLLDEHLPLVCAVGRAHEIHTQFATIVHMLCAHQTLRSTKKWRCTRMARQGCWPWSRPCSAGCTWMSSVRSLRMLVGSLARRSAQLHTVQLHGPRQLGPSSNWGARAPGQTRSACPQHRAHFSTTGGCSAGRQAQGPPRRAGARASRRGHRRRQGTTAGSTHSPAATPAA